MEMEIRITMCVFYRRFLCYKMVRFNLLLILRFSHSNLSVCLSYQSVPLTECLHLCVCVCVCLSNWPTPSLSLSGECVNPFSFSLTLPPFLNLIFHCPTRASSSLHLPICPASHPNITSLLNHPQSPSPTYLSSFSSQYNYPTESPNLTSLLNHPQSPSPTYLSSFSSQYN